MIPKVLCLLALVTLTVLYSAEAAPKGPGGPPGGPPGGQLGGPPPQGGQRGASDLPPTGSPRPFSGEPHSHPTGVPPSPPPKGKGRPGNL